MTIVFCCDCASATILAPHRSVAAGSAFSASPMPTSREEFSAHSTKHAAEKQPRIITRRLTLRQKDDVRQKNITLMVAETLIVKSKPTRATCKIRPAQQGIERPTPMSPRLFKIFHLLRDCSCVKCVWDSKFMCSSCSSSERCFTCYTRRTRVLDTGNWHVPHNFQKHASTLQSSHTRAANGTRSHQNAQSNHHDTHMRRGTFSFRAAMAAHKAANDATSSVRPCFTNLPIEKRTDCWPPSHQLADQ